MIETFVAVVQQDGMTAAATRLGTTQSAVSQAITAIETGLGTRLISVPFIIEMIVAMLSTKIALYYGISPLPKPPAPPQVGIWAVLHEVRSDYAQIASVAFLLAACPGPWSLDALLRRKRAPGQASPLQTTALAA